MDVCSNKKKMIAPIIITVIMVLYANANTTALIYAHQIAVARATASEVRAGVFANRK